MTSLAAVLHGPKDLRIEERPVKPLNPQEVCVAVRAVGICGSDLHYYVHGRNGAFAVKDPMVLGHEGAGEVVKVGSAVTHLKPGDRVAIEPGLPCQKCFTCRSGRYNLCKEVQFSASAKLYPHKDGVLQQFVNHHADFCHLMPSTMSFEEGALLEPLAVALQAIDRSNIKTGSSVLIYGAGAVGLLVGICARAAGASNITIIDIDEGRLKFAQSYCADNSYKIDLKSDKDESNLDYARETVQTMLKLGSVKEADYVFECTGQESCTQMSILTAKAGGKVAIIGMGNPVQTVNLGDASLREVDIIGVFRYANQYPKAINLVSSKRIPLDGIITHRVELQNAEDAFKICLKGGNDCRKAVILCKDV